MAYTIVQNESIRCNLKPNAKIVYIIILSYNNKVKGYSYPTINTIMKNANIRNKSTVIKAIKELEENGYIVVKRKHGENNRYFVVEGS